MKRPGYTKESYAQRLIREFLTSLGIPNTSTNAKMIPCGKGFRRLVGTPGWPDITAVLPGGTALCIEVKARYGRVRPDQRRVLDMIVAQGGICILARTVEDVKEVLQDYMEKRDGDRSAPLPRIGGPYP